MEKPHSLPARLNLEHEGRQQEPKGYRAHC
jgi:hypothetical protein